jgi:predicted ATPase with chaperone activity
MADVRESRERVRGGQETAKRALEVAAAGGHNLLMIGPPGSGKSMLARRLPSILPPLEPSEMLEVSMIRSLAGDLAGGRIGRTRPFRAPHHSASMAALVGAASASSFSTSCRSSIRKSSTRCASRSRPARR